MSSVLLALVLSVFVLAVAANDLFMHSAVDAEGNKVPLSKYRDAKAIIIVNVASNCGYTYTNYNQLMELYEKYHKRGLEILAFPSNQFGEQEPGNNAEIQAFCKNYGVTFPVFAKVRQKTAIGCRSATSLTISPACPLHFLLFPLFVV